MKSIRQVLVVGIAAFATMFGAVANAQNVSGTNTSNSQANTNASSTTANYFTSPADSTSHYDYSGQYTVKSNSSVVLGAFAPSMSGYNCSATAQAGASQSNAGLTAALGIPLLMDPGMMCVFFTLANQDLQIAIALAPKDIDAAMIHIKAAENNQCNIGEVYEAARLAQRAAGIDCPLGDGEKKKIDKNVQKQWSSRDASKPFAAGIDMNVENDICGDDPSPKCIARIQKRVAWKSQELATPSL